MDLSYGTQYIAFREEVRQFIAVHQSKAPSASAMRGPEGLAWQKLLIEHGYHSRTIPKDYGGYGAVPDILQSRIIGEEFSAAKLNTGLGGQGISMLTPVLLEMGTQAQKLQFIKPTIMGEMIWCQGYSEPGAGSDLASLTTKAELDGDEWVING
ncbi:MAG: alkylation response protein AidB-like acyl-CoA dehydrogenase, partial [Bacteroidia bacterium]